MTQTLEWVGKSHSVRRKDCLIVSSRLSSAQTVFGYFCPFSFISLLLLSSLFRDRNNNEKQVWAPLLSSPLLLPPVTSIFHICSFFAWFVVVLFLSCLLSVICIFSYFLTAVMLRTETCVCVCVWTLHWSVCYLHTQMHTHTKKSQLH